MGEEVVDMVRSTLNKLNKGEEAGINKVGVSTLSNPNKEEEAVETFNRVEVPSLSNPIKGGEVVVFNKDSVVDIRVVEECRLSSSLLPFLSYKAVGVMI